MSHFELLDRALLDVYADSSDTVFEISRYFHQEFSQTMNGKGSNFIEFQEHVLMQKKAMHSVRFEFKKVIEEKDFLACHYHPIAVGLNGQPIEAQVHAFFEFKDKKIFRIDGQVRFLKGEPSLQMS